MSTVICLGGGEIGCLGVRSLLGDGARVLVVDPDEDCLARPLCQRRVDSPDKVLVCSEGQALYMKGDGIDVLADVLQRWTPDQVVPAAPGHLAARLAMAWSLRSYRPIVPFGGPLLKVVDALPSDTVQLIDSIQGVLAASHMPSDMLCREGCEQPSVCPVTGNGLTPMHQHVDRALAEAVDRCSVMVTAGAKVGAIRGSDIRKMFDILGNMGEGMTVGIATSCRCHAIVNIFRYGSE